MLRKIRMMPQSIAGQLALLSLVFAVFAFLYLAFPFWSYLSDRDPLDRTIAYAEISIISAAAADIPEGDLARRLGELPEIAEIAAANPGFRYFVDRNNEQVQFGSAPRWQGAINFNHLALASEAPEDPADCQSTAWWRAVYDEDGVPVVIGYQSCGADSTYYEFAGVTTPIERANRFFDRRNLKIIWNQSRNTLAGILGITLIGFIVIWATTRSLRRLIDVTESFDEESSEHVLPTEGLPREIVPLVRAMNRMMRRIDAGNKKQAFFLATAAHEMRTPMAILRNRLERLPESQDKEDLRNDIRRVTGLLEQLLQLMSIGETEEFEDTVNLVTAAKAVVMDRVPLAVESGVEIEFVSEVDSAFVSGDQRLLQVAISNLVDNAISFSNAGNTLTVCVADGPRVSVSDQGPGISEDVIGTVFEPFAKNPPNRNGHGLGLAIVKAVVNLHNGEVSVTNNASGGANFSLQF